MSYAAEQELRQFEEQETKWAALCKIRKWFCKVCGETPMFEERALSFEEDQICAHCQARIHKWAQE